MPPVQEAIRVMVRIKPPPRFGIERDPSNEKVLNCGDRSFIFDHIFAAQVKDDEVFEKVCYSLIDNAIKGYNSTLFVYGQTGTGKTYTMNGNNNDEGVLHRSVKLLRQKIVNDTNIENSSFKMSFLEIYNEKVRDLLSDSFKNVREMAKQGFFVEDLKEIFIESEEDFTKHSKKGNLSRITKPTNMNATSSRSHSILTLSLETKQMIDGNMVIKSSKINFVDLAGSQNLNQTGAVGDRKTEARNINMSLQALRKVITALEQKRTKNISHIPYRDSVLTQLLKDSLGGNTSTVIIGTISSDQKYIKETLSTLNFLESAKKIKNVKKINQKLEGNEERLKLTLKAHEERIDLLENQLREIKKQLSESKQMEENYVKQIEQLHERILEYDKPRSLFDTLSNMEKQEVFSYFPSQQTMSEDEQLPIVQEEQIQFSFGKGSSKITVEAKDKTEKDYDIELMKKSKKSNFSETLVNMNTLLYEQIKYLNKKNATFYEESNDYDRLLQLIESNIDNLSFDQAQLKILDLQYTQLQHAKAQISEVEEHNLKLCRMHEEQKKQYEERLKFFSHKEISNIKEKSQLMSQESKLNRDVDTLQDKINSLESEIVQIEEKYKSQVLKLEMKASNLFLERERFSNECLVLQKDKTTLEETNKIQEETFRQAFKKMLEEETQKKQIQIEDILNRCKQQLTSKEEEVKKKNESLLKEFLELERENNHLKARIQQINSQMQEQNDKYSNSVEDYEQLKAVFAQKQIEMKMKIDEGLEQLLEKDEKIKILDELLEQKQRDIQRVKNQTKFMTLFVDDEEISYETLSFRYQDLKQKEKMFQNSEQNQVKIQKKFNEEIIQKNKQIEELSKYLRELVDNTKIFSKQYDEKINIIQTLESTIKNLKKQLSLSMSLNNLRIQLEENDRNKLSEVQNTHKMYEKEIESLKMKLQEKKEENEKACEQFQKKIDSYYNAYKNQQSKAQKGQKQCRQNQKRIERLELLLQNEKKSSNKVFEKYKRHLQQKQQAIKNLCQDMKEQQEKISMQFKELSNKQKIIQQYKRRFQGYQTISIVNEIYQKKRQSSNPFRNRNYSME